MCTADTYRLDGQLEELLSAGQVRRDVRVAAAVALSTVGADEWAACRDRGVVSLARALALVQSSTRTREESHEVVEELVAVAAIGGLAVTSRPPVGRLHDTGTLAGVCLLRLATDDELAYVMGAQPRLWQRTVEASFALHAGAASLVDACAASEARCSPMRLVLCLVVRGGHLRAGVLAARLQRDPAARYSVEEARAELDKLLGRFVLVCRKAAARISKEDKRRRQSWVILSKKGEKELPTK